MSYHISPLDFTNEDEYNAARFEEELGFVGDPRRCSTHPYIIISSPDGLFDGVCGACEAECEDARSDRSDA